MGSYTLAVFVSVLSVASFIIYPSSGVSHDTLATICSKTQNHDACERMLESDSRTSSADLPKLSLISIELTMKQADDSHKTLSELRDNATEHWLKNSFNQCVGLFKEMKAKIQVAHQLSQKRQYKNITELAQAERLAYECAYRIPINSLAIDDITQMMILACQTSRSVNQYVANSFG